MVQAPVRRGFPEVVAKILPSQRLKHKIQELECRVSGIFVGLFCDSD